MFLLKIFKIIKVFFLKKFKKGTSQNAVNDFGSCELFELGTFSKNKLNYIASLAKN